MATALAIGIFVIVLLACIGQLIRIPSHKDSKSEDSDEDQSDKG